MVLTECIWFNHLPTEAHLGCFQFLAIMKIADRKIGVFFFFFVFCTFFVWFWYQGDIGLIK